MAVMFCKQCKVNVKLPHNACNCPGNGLSEEEYCNGLREDEYCGDCGEGIMFGYRATCDKCKAKACKHENMKDFSYAKFDTDKKFAHFYCPDCKAHWWKGREWTAEEWFGYVNGGDSA